MSALVKVASEEGEGSATLYVVFRVGGDVTIATTAGMAYFALSASAGASADSSAAAGPPPEPAPLNLASNSARSLSDSALAAAVAASASVHSRRVERRARPLKASGLSGGD